MPESDNIAMALISEGFRSAGLTPPAPQVVSNSVTLRLRFTDKPAPGPVKREALPAPGAQGETHPVPNPAWFPKGAQQQIWGVGAEGA